jgi:hypothetical protein
MYLSRARVAVGAIWQGHAEKRGDRYGEPPEKEGQCLVLQVGPAP